MATEKSSLPEAVAWQEQQEQTLVVRLTHEGHQGITKTKEYLRYAPRCGFQDWIKWWWHTSNTATLVILSLCHRSTSVYSWRTCQGTMERCGYSLLGTNLRRRVPADHCVQAVQVGGGRVRQLFQCQSSYPQAQPNLCFTRHTCMRKQRQCTLVTQAGFQWFQQVFGFPSWWAPI